MKKTAVTIAALAVTAATAFTTDKTVGLQYNDSTKSTKGYTLFTGKHDGRTWLIDNNGQKVHEWPKTSYEPGQSVYLTDKGELVRAQLLKTKYSIGGGEGGRFEMYSWEGDTIWQFNYADSTHQSHHDFAILPDLPDGRKRILAMAVEKKTRAECAAVGFDTTLFQESYISPEFIVELVQDGKNGYTTAWEWHVWDHLIQNKFPDKPNYGNPAEHPELIDVASGTGKQLPAFWNHANSIKYNAKFDQIMLNNRGSSEFFVIDHSTTTAEAATETGGTYGKGGGLLYRWGNPQAYSCGTVAQRRLYQQHDAQWIESGLPGEWNVLIYSNGIDRPGVKFSSIEEVDIPQDTTTGTFPTLASGQAYEPLNVTWHYQAAPDSAAFYSPEVSGAQRMPNGNTLICEGVPGRFFEITNEGEIVWQYENPVVVDSILTQGDTADIDPRGHPNNAVFKIHRYMADFVGFAGKDLTPYGVIENDPNATAVANPIRTSSTGMSLTNGSGMIRLNLGSSVKDGVVKLFGMNGRMIRSVDFSGTGIDISTAGIAAGVYHLQCRIDGNYLHQSVVIK